MSAPCTEPGAAGEAARTGGVAVGVVLVNRHGASDTLACLDSLAAALPRPAAVVVVENASSDDSLERLRAWPRERGIPCVELVDDEPLHAAAREPWLVLVRLGEHRGFSGGNNVGLRLLRRRRDVSHVLLLNNDTEVAPDYFAALDAAFDAVPDADLLSGTIYHHAERDRVWYAGGVAIPWRSLALHRTARPRSDAPVPTEFITGCALVISRRALDVLGPLPECYFPAYLEDTEYCHRARAAGLRVIYAPAPVVYHKIGATARRPATQVVLEYLATRHRGFYVRRNLRGVERAVAALYLVATKSGRALVEALRGQPSAAWAMLRGMASGLLSPAARRDARRW